MRPLISIPRCAASLLGVFGLIVVVLLTAGGNCPARDLTAPTNHPPTISIDPSFVFAGTIRPPGVVSPILFSVNDQETPTTALKITASSSDQDVVSDDNMFITGTGTIRSLSILPAILDHHTADITITATDTEGGASSVTFRLITAGVWGPILTRTFYRFVDTQQQAELGLIIGATGTPLDLLLISAESSNQALVPNQNLTWIGSGTNRTLNIVPISNVAGESTITVTAIDVNNFSTSTQIKFSLPNATNQPPTISTIRNQATCPGEPAREIPFAIGDDKTDANVLTVLVDSSDKQILPVTHIVFGGSGTNRAVSLFPIKGASGQTTVTVTVIDSDGAASNSSFDFFVRCPTNHPPTISSIPDQVVNPGAITGIKFHVNDLETPTDALTLKAVSSNQRLVPDANVFFGGAGTNRTLSVFHVANQSGSAVITITVTDTDGASASTQFNFTVSGPPDRAPLPGDFNFDHLPDIVLQHIDGSLAVWFMNKDKDEELVAASYFNPTGVVDTRWQIAAVADLNGDGHSDLIFQHADGTVAAWLMDGINLVTPTLLSPSQPGPGWRVVGAGDVNRDGHDDILFQHTDGSLAVWLMHGTNLVYATFLNPARPADRRWRVVGTGDFTQVGAVDLVFQHDDGTLAVWLMNGADLIQGELLNPAAPSDKNWRVVGTVDLNRDGKTDLLFQHTDGSVGVWFMDGVNLLRATLLNPSNAGDGWRIVGPK